MSDRYIEPPPSIIRDFGIRWIEWISRLHQVVKNLLSDKTSHVSIQNANFGKGSTAPTQVIVGDYNGWRFQIGDDAVITIEMPHNVDDTKAVELHFTFAINEAYATNSGEVQFQMDYSVTPHSGGNLNTPGTSGTVTTGDINIPATAYDTYHSSVAAIPAGSYSNGSVIGLTFSRIAITGGNNPTAHPIITSIHLEYTAKAVDWYSE